MTKASLTDRQAISSTPLALSASKLFTKLGTCLAEQVGVKAPGSANSTAFLPANSSSDRASFGPSTVMYLSFTDGIFSPTLIVMARGSSLLDVMGRTGLRARDLSRGA